MHTNISFTFRSRKHFPFPFSFPFSFPNIPIPIHIHIHTHIHTHIHIHIHTHIHTHINTHIHIHTHINTHINTHIHIHIHIHRTPRVRNQERGGLVAVAGGDVATALDQQVKDGEVVSGRRPVNRAIAIPVAMGKVLFWRNKREKESKYLW